MGKKKKELQNLPPGFCISGNSKRSIVVAQGGNWGRGRVWRVTREGERGIQLAESGWIGMTRQPSVFEDS